MMQSRSSFLFHLRPWAAPAAAAMLLLWAGAGSVVAQQAAPNSIAARATADTTPASPAAADNAAAPGDFRLGPDDVIDVEVWNEPNVSGKIPVRPDGKISLPLVGELMAAGRTPMQLQAEITEKLSASIDQPSVTVVVEQVNSRKVNVMGQVVHPGTFSLATEMTMLDAIALAGGPAPFAHLGKIYMIRSVNGVPWRYPFDYKKVISGLAPKQNITLQPGDTIVVP